MNSSERKCPACGKPMFRVKVLPKIMTRLNRYRCQCGHWEDDSPAKNGSEQPVAEILQLRNLTQPA